MHRLLLCAGVATCVTAAAAEPPDPAARLVESAQAARTSTFQGVVIYRGDDRFEVLRIQHRFKDDSERERLVSLTGEPRQVLRIDNRLICVLPKGKSMSVERPSVKGFLSQLTPERVRDLAQWYEFRDEGEGRIAGRPCRGAAIAPRDGFRYGYEVWTDEETKLPLKISLTGSRGEVLEQVMFTEVSFPPSIADEAFETEVDERKFSTYTRNLPRLDAPQPNPEPVGEASVHFEQLPPGFRVVIHDGRALPDGAGRLEHLLLSDGLSAVSVFSEISQHEEKPAFSGVSHMGPVQAYGRTVGSFHITIVGEVPPQAIRMIGDNLRVPLPAAAGAVPATANN